MLFINIKSLSFSLRLYFWTKTLSAPIQNYVRVSDCFHKLFPRHKNCHGNEILYQLPQLFAIYKISIKGKSANMIYYELIIFISWTCHYANFFKLFFAYRNVLIVAVHVLFHILSFNIFSPVAEHRSKILTMN